MRPIFQRARLALRWSRKGRGRGSGVALGAQLTQFYPVEGSRFVGNGKREAEASVRGSRRRRVARGSGRLPRRDARFLGIKKGGRENAGKITLAYVIRRSRAWIPRRGSAFFFLFFASNTVKPAMSVVAIGAHIGDLSIDETRFGRRGHRKVALGRNRIPVNVECIAAMFQRKNRPTAGNHSGGRRRGGVRTPHDFKSGHCEFRVAAEALS